MSRRLRLWFWLDLTRPGLHVGTWNQCLAHHVEILAANTNRARLAKSRHTNTRIYLYLYSPLMLFYFDGDKTEPCIK